MSLWSAREGAQRDLALSLSSHRVFFEDLFHLLSVVIEEFNACGVKSGMPRIAGMTTAKGASLLHCCYSLSLNAHSQEAGALLRIAAESIEALRYLSLDPTRVAGVEKTGFPKAGDLAKAIAGDFKPLRDFLNQNSSHMSLSGHAIGHLEVLENGRIATHHRHEPEVLRVNLNLLAAFGAFLCIESHGCLHHCAKDRAGAIAPLVLRIKERSLALSQSS